MPTLSFFSRFRGRSFEDRRLLEAAEHADVSSVRRLLDAGAYPDVRDGFRYTPLMRAVSRVSDRRERGAVIDLLLASGADVNAVEQAGQTALIHAAHSDNR
jgi:ankyrin repeat protein